MRKIFFFIVPLFLFFLTAKVALAQGGCLSGGVQGVCSAQNACSGSGQSWSSIYSPINSCLGSGGGCCTAGGNTELGAEHGKCGANAIDTAIGCVPVLGSNGTNDFITFVLRWAVGIGGGIAFALGIYAGFMIMTSSGNPERLKAGQELLTSAISGLILLIFSVFILKFIGVDILGLGQFGFGK